MQCEPAASLINRLGGLTKVAEVCDVNISTVQRWRMPREKGGTGGFIPHWYVHRLLEAASERGLPLNPVDFMPASPVPAQQGSA